MVSTLHTRRAVFGAMALAPVVIAMPAMAAAAPHGSTDFATLYARAKITQQRFNDLPEEVEYNDEALFERETAIMTDASTALDHATPTTMRELVQLMEHTIGDGQHPGREICDLLIAHTRRLARV